MTSNFKEANQDEFKFLDLEHMGDLLQPKCFIALTFIKTQTLKIKRSHKDPLAQCSHSADEKTDGQKSTGNWL